LDELVDIVKIKQNQEIKKEKLSLKKMAEKAISHLKAQVIELKAEINTDFKELDTIIYPKIYMESIFLNLLSNSLKYDSPERTPEIWIQTKLEGNYQILKFTDNGLGIDMEKYGGKVFQLHKTFHKHKQGKGLGLFMTRNQIEALGGTITINSELNKGTSFTIILNKYNS